MSRQNPAYTPLAVPPTVRVDYANGLASFMSERATGTAFGSTSCVGSVGTLAASTEWFAGEEASNAPGITSVRISQGSIRPDECAVGGAALRVRPARCSLREESDGNAPRKRNGTGASSYWHMKREVGNGGSKAKI